MKTLYIDVYFMINFTVDILAIFVALKTVHISTNIRRLIVSGLLGALLAVCELFVVKNILHILLAAFFVFLISNITCREASLLRKIKFLISFYISSFLISGAVNFVYSLMDRYLEDVSISSGNSANRRMLIFSLIILMMIGVLRLFIMVFANSINEKSVRIIVELGDEVLGLDALVDTGNLVKDPMNMNPVIFLKRSYAEKIIPTHVIELSHIDTLSNDFKKRIRLIPVTRNSETHVMTGIRVDKVIIYNGKSKEPIDATIVIDKEEGTYGGYYALVPYVAVCNNG